MRRDVPSDADRGSADGDDGAVARIAAVAAALFLLLLVVAVASGSRGGGGIAAAPRPVPGVLFDYLFTLGILFAIGGAIALLVFRPPLRAQDESPGFLRRLLLSLVPLAVFTLLAYLAVRALGRGGVLHEAVQGLLERRPPPVEPGREGRDSTAPPLQVRWDLVALAGALAVAAAAAFVGRRLRSRELSSLPTLGERLVGVLDDTLDDLRSERDARRAVIAAYARMEGTLAVHGLPRRPSEAPFEYLARALRDLHVPPAAALDLTALFERAKFSVHAIDGAMKDEAIAALATVRDELRPAA